MEGSASDCVHSAKLAARKDTLGLLDRVIAKLQKNFLSVDDSYPMQLEVNQSWARLFGTDSVIVDAHQFMTHYISDIKVDRSDLAFRVGSEKAAASFRNRLIADGGNVGT